MTAMWPQRTYWAPQDTRAARRLATQVVAAVGRNPLAWLAPGRFEVKDSDEEAGGLEALCLPMSDDRFRFVIFGQSDRARLFLIAHEAAHTFFYVRSDGCVPKRSLAAPHWWTTHEEHWEERFCDTFALAALGLRGIPRGLTREVAA